MGARRATGRPHSSQRPASVRQCAAYYATMTTVMTLMEKQRDLEYLEGITVDCTFCWSVWDGAVPKRPFR